MAERLQRKSGPVDYHESDEPALVQGATLRLIPGPISTVHALSVHVHVHACGWLKQIVHAPATPNPMHFSFPISVNV